VEGGQVSTPGDRRAGRGQKDTAGGGAGPRGQGVRPAPQHPSPPLPPPPRLLSHAPPPARPPLFCSSLLTGGSSHKRLADEPAIIRAYYTLPYALFAVCLANETHLVMRFVDATGTAAAP
jgi:hypothetical protein